MTKKMFLVCRLIIAMLIGGTVGTTFQTDQWYLPVLCIIAGMALLYVCKTKVKDVLVDERDNKIGGQAARAAFSIYSITMCILGIISVSIGRTTVPEMLVTGYVMLYSTCALVLLYSILFIVYSKKGE